MAKISIVIPTLNESHYLPRSMKSLAEQTVMPFEIVIIDGGSTDETESIVSSFSERIPGIRFITQAGNELEARNYGGNASHGDVILFTSADVIFPPKTIELVSKSFDCDPSLIALTGLPVPFEATQFMRFEYHAWNDLKVLFAWLPKPFKTFVTSSSFLAVKRNVFLGIGQFETYNVNGDGAFGIELIKHGNVEFRPEIKYLLSSRRYNKTGSLRFNKQFGYNVLEDFFPVISKIPGLDSFKTTIRKGHKTVG